MIKIERILCPVDLPLNSDEPLRYAAKLARAHGAKLYVCHCEEELATEGSVTRSEFEATIKKLLADSHSRGSGNDASSSLDWENILIEGSNPAEAITREAAERGVDLIVMCSRRRPLRAALLGSTAEHVYRHAPCPVLITHPDQQGEAAISSETIRPRRVLVAHDFSDYSELALSYARTLARESQAELHLLHVLALPVLSEPELAWMPSSVEETHHKAARALQNAVPDGEAYPWRNVKHIVRRGQPYREILAYARENEIELILMGVHGAGFGMRKLFGSNVDRVIRQSPCPTLVARPLKPQGPSLQIENSNDQRRIDL